LFPSPAATDPADLGVTCVLFLSRQLVDDDARVWNVSGIGTCDLRTVVLPIREREAVVPPAPVVPLAPTDPRIEGYRAGFRLATVGTDLALIGLGTAFGGYIFAATRPTDFRLGAGLTVMGVGAAAVAIAPPFMAAGTHRSARELRRMGIDMPTGLSVATWALWGSGLSGMTGYLYGNEDLGTAGAFLFELSFITGGIQMFWVDNAYHSSGLAPARLSVSVVPSVTADGRGVALVGSF
jgi:hypothetical protein